MAILLAAKFRHLFEKIRVTTYFVPSHFFKWKMKKQVIHLIGRQRCYGSLPSTFPLLKMKEQVTVFVWNLNFPFSFHPMSYLNVKDASCVPSDGDKSIPAETLI